jgi:hypothetical protein
VITIAADGFVAAWLVDDYRTEARRQSEFYPSPDRSTELKPPHAASAPPRPTFAPDMFPASRRSI